MRKSLFAAFLMPLLASCLSSPVQPSSEDFHPSDYVSTLVGTASEHAFSTGNTYPAVAVPWGMNFYTPQTGENASGWTYTYSDHRIRGFKQTHQPSPWINDYGAYSLMPVVGEMVSQQERASWFSHQAETASPYLYSVYLADHDTWVELTPTCRAAVMRLTYPQSDLSALVVDAFQGGGSLRVLEDGVTVLGTARNNHGGVPDNFCNYFCIRLSKPIEGFTLYDGDMKVEGPYLQAGHPQARLAFKTCKGEVVEVRMASSFISHEQALRNLDEVTGKSFSEVQEQARKSWDDVLGRIRVEGGSQKQLRTFYSCLYRATLFPRRFYELDAQGAPVHYSPYSGQVAQGYLYTDTGVWDTFRSLFPLMNLMYPSVSREVMASQVNTYRESGFLPEWASPGHRNCMVGNNSASVVSDGILKHLAAEEDIPLLYEAMMHARTAVHPEVPSTGRLGWSYYNDLGYVPSNVGINESAARTLEYAYDDWCIAQVAGVLGKDSDREMLLRASRNYRNLFDASSLLMRGRLDDGTFETPFSTYKWGGVFTEGNAWHYTWSVFQDVEGLRDLMGGEASFRSMLDSVFVVPPVYDDSYYGARIHEITEMQVAGMGNYAHGNQPAQHMIYLYDWTSQPRKAQYWIREVLDRLYSDAPDGYCGDEDNGQTSAWYVFSSLGFYPVNPCSGEYATAAPLFEKATLRLENGKEVVISAPGNGPQTRYVRQIRWNGKRLDRPFIGYEDLLGGGELRFDMEP